VLDGTGAPGVIADIAVDGEKIRRIGPALDQPAEKTLEARGLVAAPGFIDIHAHGGAGILERKEADSKACDGVTTEALGNCGSSPFPSNAYRSAAGFFDAVDAAGTGINRVFLVGLGSIRAFVIGPDAQTASADDIQGMQQELTRALEDGAFGFSTGLIYPPGCFATADELAEVAAAARPFHTLHSTHMRSEADHIEAAIDEAEQIARAAGARLQISHLKLAGARNWHKIDWLEARLNGLRSDGLDLACDRYTYIASNTDLGVILPNWAQEGTAAERMARLKDPATRRRIEQEILALHPEPEYWDKILLAWVPDGVDRSYNGKTLRQVGELRDQRPLDVVVDLLSQHEPKPSIVIFSMCEDNLLRILSWPFVGVGSDARARLQSEAGEGHKPHPRAYGTFARYLGKYVRDEGILPLEEAVRKITALPAARLGLTDRGVLRAGAFADITLFDPDQVADRATFDEPQRPSAGIPHVLINGRLAVENGEPTGALSGRMLRKQL